MSAHVLRAPADYARYLAHLLAGTERPFWGCHYLPNIVSQLRSQANAADIRRIQEESLRLGCSDAASW
jgi:hypothetical protein